VPRKSVRVIDVETNWMQSTARNSSRWQLYLHARRKRAGSRQTYDLELFTTVDSQASDSEYQKTQKKFTLKFTRI
jgi:hypothetical protein